VHVWCQINSPALAALAKHLQNGNKLIRHTLCRKLAQRPLGVFGFQVDDRYPSPLKASAQATRIRLRCTPFASIARTPHDEGLKAPAKTAARAPPDRAGHPKLTARSYPPLPLSPAAIRSLLCVVCPAFLVYPVLEILGRTSRCDPPRAPVQSSCVLTQAEPTEATLTAGRGESVA